MSPLCQSANLSIKMASPSKMPMIGDKYKKLRDDLMLLAYSLDEAVDRQSLYQKATALGTTVMRKFSP
ncbi:hypothetical protein DNTS_008587 [Danionella cerebrum]|uniref:Uncharacterized protein n=1 Tax=Danionella cerebrum TaxID=2873325 RepID=A0A553R935_9TELE|nr:hypothetical protein DNTS_008587 [Danionella translucida]